MKKPTYEALEQRIRELESDAKTRERRPEPERRENGKWYRMLFEENANPIAVINRQGRYLDANKAFLEFVEEEKETLLRMNVFDFTPPPKRRKEEESHIPLWRKGGTLETEYLINGRIKVLELRIAPIIFRGSDAVIGIGKDITDRKQAEAELHLFKSIIEHSNEAMAISDSRGRLVYINPAHEKLFGKTLREAQQMNYRDYYPAESIEVIERVVAPALNRGESWEGILDAYDAEGRRFPLWERAGTIRDAEGNMRCGFGFMHDDTERIRAENALRESEALKKAILDASIDSIRLVDRDMRIIWANRITEEQVGKTATEIIGECCHSLFTGREEPCPNCPTLKSLESGKIEHAIICETDVKGIEGPSYWADYAVPIKDDSGAIVNFIQVSREVTELIEMQRSLEKSERKFRSMMEAMKDRACICSSALVVEYMNPKMVAGIGRDATGDLCHNAFYGLDERCPWCVFDRILQGEHVAYELCSPRDNRYYDVSNSPIRNPDESISKLTIFRDITETKAIEAQLRHARKMESIGTMAGGIAHDFNNLLYMITGNAELAMEDLLRWSPAHDHLMEIKKAGMRAAGIVRQLLKFSHKADVEMRTIDVMAVIRDLEKLLRSSIPSAIDIRTHIPDTEVTISGDAIQINQVIMNLCANAAQAMESSGGVLEISADTVALDRDALVSMPDAAIGNYVKITVRDTGPGIDPKIIDRIFDPYFTTKEVGKGSGLGLAVVHGIVKSHNGAVSVDSKPGNGAAFHVFLPLVGESPTILEKSSVACHHELYGR